MIPFPQAVVFDLDGTLVEFPRQFLFEQVRQVLPFFDLPPVEHDELERRFREFDFFGFIDTAIRQEFIKHYWSEFRWDLFPHPKTIPGVPQFLHNLRARDMALAIATARLGPSSIIEEALSLHTSIAEHFSHVASRKSEELYWADKKPQIVEACAALSVSPSEVVFVGDIPEDIVSAKNAGVGCTVAVLSGGIFPHVLEKVEPDYVVEDVCVLEQLLP